MRSGRHIGGGWATFRFTSPIPRLVWSIILRFNCHVVRAITRPCFNGNSEHVDVAISNSLACPHKNSSTLTSPSATNRTEKSFHFCLSSVVAKAKEVRRKIVEHNPCADTINRESIERGRAHVSAKRDEAASSSTTTTTTTTIHHQAD